MIDDDLGAAHRVVVLGRDLEGGLEAFGIAGLGKELLGLDRIVRHPLGDIHEVRVEGVHIGAENPAVPEHGPLEHLLLVDRVGDGQAHALVGVGLLGVVHAEGDVVRAVAQNDLEAPILLEVVDVLRPQPERRDIDVARLERGQRRVGIGDEAVRHLVEPRQALLPVVPVPDEHDAVPAHPVADREGARRARDIRSFWALAAR